MSLSIRLRIAIFAMLVLLTACRAPIFRSHDERFGPAPELIAQVEPYLERLATTPPEETLEERRQVAAQIDGIWFIDTEYERCTQTGEKFYVLNILLDMWEDWQRGYFYVYDGSELSENPSLQLLRVDEHFCIFNRNL